MRNDLTANFLAKMSDDNRKPIQLVVFKFLSVGNIYLSDRDIIISNQLYKGLIENWGELITTDYSNNTSGTMEITITLWNGGEFPFSNYFRYENPSNTFVTIYQGFIGLEIDDFAVLGEFVIQDPIEYSEAERLLNLDLVTTNLRYYGQVGSLLTKEFFPYALESDVNKSIDLIIGDAGNVKCLCSKTPSRCTLSGSILLLPTVVFVLEDLDELEFLDFGYIQIDAEILYYDYRGSNYFNVTIRGYNSLKSEHSDGSVILQANTTIEYIVGQGPISSIENVKVEGQTPTVNYTVHPEENPAVIRFEKQPTFVEYSKGARNADIDFDAVATSHNTAYQPEYAYNTQFRSSGALIDENHTRLALLQTDDPIDDGELIKVFLNIEHWATALYANDRVDVYVDGIGILGYLSKPNAADIATFTAEVDIDHEHEHVSGGNHDHNFTNPNIETINPNHNHGISASGEVTTRQTNADIPEKYYLSYTSGTSFPVTYIQFGFNNVLYEQYTAKKELTVSFYAAGFPGASKDIYDNCGNRWEVGAGITVVSTFPVSKGFMYYRLYYPSKSNVAGANVFVRAITLTQTEIGTISANAQKTNSDLTSKGDVWLQNVDSTSKQIKSSDDVIPFATSNRQLENIVTTKTSKTYTDKFDLTKTLDKITWNWLKNRRVELRYVGTVNNAQIIITYMYFTVEYRQKQIKTTDNVTAYVKGLINSRPDKVIEYLLIEKANFPSNMLSSVYRNIPKWDDNEVWNDIEIWNDEGQVTGVPEGALFEEAASWFNYAGYTIDGIIAGNLSVKEAIQNITIQTRSKLLFQNGFAKLIILREQELWKIAKDITPNDYQLKSLSASHTRVDEIVNKIDLFYDIDRLSAISGEGKFNKTAFRTDLESINKHGERKNNEFFMFDLIRNELMAEDIINYYIWKLGETRTLYDFNTYLNQFDIEKSDYITFTSSGFDNLLKRPLSIEELKRIFGSGKNRQINIINMIGESARHKDYILSEEDIVNIIDTLDILLTTEVAFTEPITIEEIINIAIEIQSTETLLFNDSLSILYNIKPSLTETILLSEQQSFELTINISDIVLLNDDLRVSQELCFGACGFGCPNGLGVKFGSKTLHNAYSDEYQSLEDQLNIKISRSIEETVNVFEEIVFSDKFGCTSGLGNGFGKSPFGDVTCS